MLSSTDPSLHPKAEQQPLLLQNPTGSLLLRLVEIELSYWILVGVKVSTLTLMLMGTQNVPVHERARGKSA
eukprot:scaffold98469_cov63-Cyclotella_meneghiniana.AAC.8